MTVPRRRRVARIAATIVLVVALAATATAAAAARQRAASGPAGPDLLRMLQEQRALIEEQQRLIRVQGDSLGQQGRQLDAMAQQLLVLERSLEALRTEVHAPEARQAPEEPAQGPPEIPPDVVAAGDFPGSIHVPGTDASVKFGGRVRTVMAFTLSPLGSTDRFLTNSIPVTDRAALDQKRTTFSANTSRLNFEMRTPAGASQMRAFIEGDFYGQTGTNEEARSSFRLRHAYAQYRRLLVGQTWSTFSDPEANYEALDLEGMNGENVIRQAQARLKWQLRDDLSLATAVETPEVSLTGGQGANLVPDFVGRAIWSGKRSGHLQGALVLRQIRGEPDSMPGATRSAFAWGGSLSGVVPVQTDRLADRVIFQVNFGQGNARYINDLNSLGGQDGVFNPATGELKALSTAGWFVNYEHQWVRNRTMQDMRLRSSFIWGFVIVENLDFQPPDAYHRTSRYSLNLIYNPIARIDAGIEFIHGMRKNKNGESGSADQIQVVSSYRF